MPTYERSSASMHQRIALHQDIIRQYRDAGLPPPTGIPDTLDPVALEMFLADQSYEVEMVLKRMNTENEGNMPSGSGAD